MNHTPGPWQIVPDVDGVSYTVVSKRGQRGLANVTGMGTANCANARLIAAAPDLLEALKAVRASVVCNNDMTTSYTIDRKVAAQMREALAKAEQEA